MNAPYPARQVALVGETRAGSDLGQAQLPVADEFDRAPQPETHDVTVRSHADGSGEDAREVERAAPRNFCQGRNFYGLIDMGEGVVFQALQHFLAQRAPCPRFGCRCVWRATRLPMKPLATSFQNSDPFG